MLSPAVVAASLAGAFLASLVLTRLVLVGLERGGVLDRPNPRSSHGQPTPRGGGLAVTVVMAASFLAIALAEGAPAGAYAVLAAALVLAAVSWRDDLVGVAVWVRLAAQAVAVAAALLASPELAGAADGWAGPLLGPVLIGFGWVWFVNLTNFMDGIDGLAAAEAACIGLGLLMLAGLGALAAPDGLRGVVAAGAALGFLVWNWHPARVFLGDVGSIPLGFLLGWLLLRAGAGGAWAAALILPGYFLADATATLVWRALRGRRPWQAHREHLYQRALRRWPRHDAVTLRIVVLNLALVGLAALSVLPSGPGPLAALAVAAALTGASGAWLGLAGRGR